MQSKIESLHTTAKFTGLEINIEKIETTRANLNQEAFILVSGQALEDVATFTYLGTRQTGEVKKFIRKQSSDCSIQMSS